MCVWGGGDQHCVRELPFKNILLQNFSTSKIKYFSQVCYVNIITLQIPVWVVQIPSPQTLSGRDFVSSTHAFVVKSKTCKVRLPLLRFTFVFSLIFEIDQSKSSVLLYISVYLIKRTNAEQHVNVYFSNLVVHEFSSEL